MRTSEIANDTETSELDSQWAVVMHFLPRGWQDAAWTYGAITRLRAIQSAEALLRLFFAYAWNDWSLRTTAAWARRIGLADISDVAVLKRLRHASAWLGFNLGSMVSIAGHRHRAEEPMPAGAHRWHHHSTPGQQGDHMAPPCTVASGHGSVGARRIDGCAWRRIPDAITVASR